MELRSDLCPPDVAASIRRYVEEGCPVGDFLTAVLENNLKESFARADAENVEALGHIVAFVWWKVPLSAWGSKERVAAWYKAHREGKAGHSKLDE